MLVRSNQDILKYLTPSTNWWSANKKDSLESPYLVCKGLWLSPKEETIIYCSSSLGGLSISYSNLGSNHHRQTYKIKGTKSVLPKDSSTTSLIAYLNK